MSRRDELHPNLVKAKAAIKARTTYQLIADLEKSDDLEKTPELPIIRGWIMDELEERNPVAFSCWLESSEPSPRKFFIPDDEAQDSTFTQDWDDFTDADPGL